MRKHAIWPTEAHVTAAAGGFRLLGDPTRLQIVLRLRQGPATVGELAEHVGAHFPATSQHLAKLRMAGMVAATRHGTHVVYELSNDHVGELVAQALAHLDHAPAPANNGRLRASRA